MSSPKKPRGPGDSDDLGTRVWRRLQPPERESDLELDTDEVQRLSTHDIERSDESVVSKVTRLGDDPVGALRRLIKAVRQAPTDQEARRKLRAYAAEHGLWEQLAVLLADEAHVDAPGAVMAALYEELAGVHENLDQPIETIAAIEAVDRGAPPEQVAALQLRLSIMYDESGDRGKAGRVLADLFSVLPEYVPGLERAAERERDPKAQAALWMAMAAVDGKHRLFALPAAGKAFGEAGDHRGAVRANKQASEQAHGKNALRATLEEVRTLGAIARATEEAAAGDKKTAEQRLRQILATRPYDVAANLALADELLEMRRRRVVIEH